MNDDYYLNFQKYPLNTFKEELIESDLLPSRQILKEKSRERFKIIEESGISTLQDLLDRLKTTKKAKKFSL